MKNNGIGESLSRISVFLQGADGFFLLKIDSYREFDQFSIVLNVLKPKEILIRRECSSVQSIAESLYELLSEIGLTCDSIEKTSDCNFNYFFEGFASRFIANAKSPKIVSLVIDSGGCRAEVLSGIPTIVEVELFGNSPAELICALAASWDGTSGDTQAKPSQKSF